MDEVNCLHCVRRCVFGMQGKNRISDCAGYMENNNGHFTEDEKKTYKRVLEDHSGNTGINVYDYFDK